MSNQAALPDLEALAAQWSLLDLAQEWSDFSQSSEQEAHQWTSSVVFEGMYCTACAINIEEALMSVPGVKSAQISAASHRGRVVWSSDQTRPSDWMKAVAKLGYRTVPANDALANEVRREDARKMLWRLGVAGLCMMQVMMYATPVYLSEPHDIAPDMVQLLRWASWVLSLPVLFFSCMPFFKTAWLDLKQRKISMDLPVAIGMLVTFVVSTLGTFEPQGPFGAEVYFDSFTMFVFFLLTGRWLELRLRDKTAGALEAVMNRLPDVVHRRTNAGEWETITLRHLRVQDVIQVRPGEAFAADAQIVAGETQVDEALLTGESRPLPRALGEHVLAGSLNLTATVQVQVTTLGKQTRFGQMVALMESASVSKPSMALLADRVAKPFLWGVLIMSALAAVWGWQYSPAHALMVAVSVLIVTCPCALSLATPAAMLSTAGALAKAGVMLRSLQALQSLAKVDTVIFDKTGTLTSEDFSLQHIATRDGIDADQALAWAAALAQHSLHPVSRSLLRAVGDKTNTAVVLDNVKEFAGQGVQATLRQASEMAGLESRKELRLGSAAFCGVPMKTSEVLQASLSDQDGWLASFEFAETPREEAAATLRALEDLGLRIRILSGDGQASVSQLATRLHIADAMGACSPEEKLKQVKLEQAQGHRVAMVGDGLNDGPVLAGADVSFALGQALPLAQSKADFVFMASNLKPLVATIRLSQQTMQIVRQNLIWAAIYNFACVPLAMLGYLPAWLAGLGMACSSLGVVLNAMRLSKTIQFDAQGNA
ncbi:cation-translocating P-type ATPase [Limnohabitans sp. Rim11]|uniref:heavy metal translocating P-type ATPase n=1 Tax=Limnohabitans sp. Rim11 TaxID=1100719 RepID=UPI000A7BA735|nr:cation-translocating P-type ATPase [Limnohabitans sp. Rim11]